MPVRWHTVLIVRHAALPNLNSFGTVFHSSGTNLLEFYFSPCTKRFGCDKRVTAPLIYRVSRVCSTLFSVGTLFFCAHRNVESNILDAPFIKVLPGTVFLIPHFLRSYYLLESLFLKVLFIALLNAVAIILIVVACCNELDVQHHIPD